MVPVGVTDMDRSLRFYLDGLDFTLKNKLTSLRDPDGYRVEFESMTDVPEDATLSEFEASKKH